MSTRDSVEELMFELLTNPNIDISKRLGAAQFFLSRVEKGSGLTFITPENLVTACRNVIEEEETGKRDGTMQKFWTCVIRIMDCASDYILPAEIQVPTIDDMERTLDVVLKSLFPENSVDLGSFGLMATYPHFDKAVMELQDMVKMLQIYRQYYTGLIPNIDSENN